MSLLLIYMHVKTIYFCIQDIPLTIGGVRRSPADVEFVWRQSGDQWRGNLLWGALLSLSLAGRAQGTPASTAGLKTDKQMYSKVSVNCKTESLRGRGLTATVTV